jgi:hypothetical protein
MFKVGDKVRMLRSSEEGVVVRIKGSIIDIETTDGFELPVVASDLSKVSEVENKYFNVSQSKKPVIEQIGLAFESVNDFLIRPYFINQFNKEVLFVLSLKKNGVYVNFASGQAGPESEIRIYEDLNKNTFEEWSKWQIDLLFFGKSKEMLQKKSIEIKLKTASLFKEEVSFPFSEKKGFIQLISLKQEENKSDVKQIGDSTFESYSFNKTKTVDLHAEKIGLVLGNPDEIFEQQKSFFIKEIDKAIVENLLEITLIHGVGNGHFKNFIHKYLSSHEQVEWFKEAQKEKFGYGATIAHFKP